MKYLQLQTQEELVIDGFQHHFTFLYFGTEPVNIFDMHEHLPQIKQFKLKAVREDMFGLNKDQPVVVYDFVDDTVRETVDSQRSKLIEDSGEVVKGQNFVPWKPHMTNCGGLQNVKRHGLEIVHVIGVKSNEPYDYFFNMAFQPTFEN